MVVIEEHLQTNTHPFPPIPPVAAQPYDLNPLSRLGHSRLLPNDLRPRSTRRCRLPSPFLQLTAPGADRQRQRLVVDGPLVLGRLPGDAGGPSIILASWVVAGGRSVGGGGRVPRGPDLGLAVEVAVALPLERLGGSGKGIEVVRRRRALVPRGAAPSLSARRGFPVGIFGGCRCDVVRARRRPVLGAGAAGVG